MRSARNQLILLGFICQGFSWDGYRLAVFNALLWVAGIYLSRFRIRLSGLQEIACLVAGAALNFAASRSFGESRHFFIGQGITMLQAVRLMRPLDRREQIFSVLMACLELAAGCTILLDIRFVIILAGAVLLIPRVLMELEMGNRWGAGLTKPRTGAVAAIAAIMAVFYLVFPRPQVGSFPRMLSGGSGSLVDSVLDPASSGRAQSSRVLMQVEGERLGYLRSFVLADFDGEKWKTIRRPKLRGLAGMDPASSENVEHRRIRVKDVGYLGRILPVDGRALRVDGKFFRDPRENAFGLVECSMMWNQGNNTYEYWSEPGPRREELSGRERDRFLLHPEISAKLREWLDHVLEGAATPAEKARRLEAYLSTHFVYRLGAPELNRLNSLEEFVLREREGHCERFASAMALLLRAEGIPSRVVVGFLPEAENWFSGWHTIRFQDAHAWTEAFLPEQGWTEFDATPAATMKTGGWGLRELLEGMDVVWGMYVVNFDRPAQSALLTESVQTAVRGLALLQKEAIRGWPIAGVVLGAGLLWGWRLKRAKRRRPASAAQPWAEAQHGYGQMLRLMARRGHRRRPDQTPHEFLRQVELQADELLPEVRMVTEIFCASRYSGRALGGNEESVMQAALERIRTIERRSAEMGRAGLQHDRRI